MSAQQAANASDLAELRALDAAPPDGGASLQEQRFLTLKYGQTFAVFDQRGDACAAAGSPEGVFHCDTRFLSHFLMLIDGQRPLLLSSVVRLDNAVLFCDASNPEITDARGNIALQKETVHIRRTRFLWKSRMLERVAVHNFDHAPRSVRLQFRFAADFADLFEVRGAKRPRSGTVHPVEVEADAVRLSYTGLDELRRETRLLFDPAPDRLAGDRAEFCLSLDAGERKTLFIEISCNREPGSMPPSRAFFCHYREARSLRRRSVARAASVTSSNDIFNEVAGRAVSDLYTLITDTEHGPYPYAGIPWYSTVFGRDALITALQMLWLDPAIARGVLTHLAATQATEFDAEADAEPGKILHEARRGEMAALGEVPFRRYYGSADATPLFVILAGAYYERTGDLITIRGLWPNIEAALVWMRDHGDCDGDGFIEYGRHSDKGLANQGWKDSHDAVFYEDGELVRGPVALVEVQAYAYGAWRAAARLAEALGWSPGEVASYEDRAGGLRREFDAAFFDEAMGTYILALDGEKRPCRVRSSNAGHALLTGIALPHRAAPVTANLMQPSMFSGWGIRTLATTEVRYNPMSYHNGSVWPHDTALVATGMARYGHRQEAARLFARLFEATTFIDQRRLPELFCGFPRIRGHGPTFYPVACSPQAWASGSVLALMQACLGLSFLPQSGYIRFDRPVLPDFLDSLTLQNLSLQAGRMDIELSRMREEVAAHVVSREGKVRVLIRS